MNEMIKICEKYSQDFNIHFNASKTKFLLFGRLSETEVTFQGKVISQISKETHVGNIVSTDIDSDKLSISKACNELYAKFNLLLRQFGMCSSHVKYKLFNSYCMSLYGSQLWNYENLSVVEPLYIAWRKCIRRIYSIPYNTHCKLVHLICEDDSIQVKLHKRFVRFLVNARRSSNKLVSIVANCALNGSSSKACKSLNYIC